MASLTTRSGTFWLTAVVALVTSPMLAMTSLSVGAVLVATGGLLTRTSRNGRLLASAGLGLLAGSLPFALFYAPFVVLRLLGLR